MFGITAEAKGESLEPVKHVQASHYAITDYYKAALLLWFLNVTCCYFRVYMVFSNIIT